MTIGQHLEALRWHVLRCVGYVAAALVVCLIFQSRLMQWATWPHRRVVSALAEEVQLEEAPPALQDLIAGANRRDMALARGLEAARRKEASLREALEPSQGRLEELAAEQAALEVELEALLAEAEAMADPPERAALTALAERRAALEARVAALHGRVEQEVHPFMDRHARVMRYELVQLRYQEGFLAFVKLALVSALFVASPLVARELWKFVAVGLYPDEKRYVHLFAPLTFGAFVVGAAFGYAVLIPLGLRFLATYPPPELVAGTFSLSDYLSLFITLTLLVGCVFELPLVMCFLSLIRVVSTEQYRAFRRYFVLVAFVVAAVLTPPDPVTQTLMAVPMLGLYEVGILLSAFVRRRDEPAPLEDDGAAPAPALPASDDAATAPPPAPTAVAPVLAPPAHETVARPPRHLLALEPDDATLARAPDGEDDAPASDPDPGPPEGGSPSEGTA